MHHTNLDREYRILKNPTTQWICTHADSYLQTSETSGEWHNNETVIKPTSRSTSNQFDAVLLLLISPQHSLSLSLFRSLTKPAVTFSWVNITHCVSSPIYKISSTKVFSDTWRKCGPLLREEAIDRQWCRHGPDIEIIK